MSAFLPEFSKKKKTPISEMPMTQGQSLSLRRHFTSARGYRREYMECFKCREEEVPGFYTLTVRRAFKLINFLEAKEEAARIEEVGRCESIWEEDVFQWPEEGDGESDTFQWPEED